MSHTTTINHLKLANCAIDQCYTSKQLLLLAQVCMSVRLCFHCTIPQALNTAYDCSYGKRKHERVMGKHFVHFNHVKIPVLNQLEKLEWKKM